MCHKTLLLGLLLGSVDPHTHVKGRRSFCSYRKGYRPQATATVRALLGYLVPGTRDDDIMAGICLKWLEISRNWLEMGGKG